MKFTVRVAGLLAGVALAGCDTNDSNQANTLNLEPAEYPSVDASFLSSTEWRFVGPYRGGRVLAVAGDADDPRNRCARYLRTFRNALNSSETV